MTHEPSGLPAGDPARAERALPLLIWLSPAFPVGAFAYSHGVEAAVEAGDIIDAASLREWLADGLRHGSVRNDAILAACAWRAASGGEFDALRDINELALALSPSCERRLEAVGQGNAFVAAIASAWPCASIDRLREAAPGDVAYPVAVAVAAAGHEVALAETLAAYVLAFVSNLVSAGVRLGVIGQTDGQAIIAALMAEVRRTASLAAAAKLEDIGGAAMRSEIASMRHELQYSRLFRS